MPGGRTHWSNKWLNLEDENGVEVFQWCKSVKGNTEVDFCSFCCKQFSVSNSGFIKVIQHSKSAQQTGFRYLFW